MQIGEQCWTKENLRTTHYNDGTPIPLYADAVAEYPTRYLLKNDEKFVAAYGYLYNWQAVTNSLHGFSQTAKEVQDICLAYYRCLKVNYEVIFGSASILPQSVGCSVRCVRN